MSAPVDGEASAASAATQEEIYRRIVAKNGRLYHLEGVTLEHPFFYLKQINDFKQKPTFSKLNENREYVMTYELKNGQKGEMFISKDKGVMDHYIEKEPDKLEEDEERKRLRHIQQIKDFKIRTARVYMTVEERQQFQEASKRLQEEKMRFRREAEETKRRKEELRVQREQIKLELFKLRKKKKT